VSIHFESALFILYIVTNIPKISKKDNKRSLPLNCENDGNKKINRRKLIVWDFINISKYYKKSTFSIA